jgi:uncharacterized membrane protein
MVYAVAFVLLTTMDGIWLGIVATTFYADSLFHLLAPQIGLLPTFLFYAIYPIGIATLAVIPSHNEKISAYGALFRGAVLGLVAYGTYGFTNAAILADWPIVVTVVDIIWGILVTALVSAMTLIIAERATSKR